MKKIITPIVALIALGINAQSYLDDAIDLSSEKIGGTARYRAMGGSMGALGNDVSAVNQLNPAGGAVAVRSHGALTLGVNSYKNETKSTSNMSNDETKFNLNQFGGVFVFGNQNMNSDWKRFAFTANYNRNNILDRQIDVAEFSSDFVYKDDYYFEEDDAFYKGDFLYDGEEVQVDGYNDKFSLGFSTNYNDVLYLGAGFDITTSQKEVYQEVKRSNQSEGVVNNKEQYYYQDGSGFALNVGMIAKVTDELRLGAAYHSPTWWYIQEDSSSGESFDESFSSDGPFIQEYNIRTPSKFVGSAALVLGKHLALNADAIFKDYSNIDFDNMAYNEESTVNQTVNKELQDTWEIRVGTEYRINDLSIRGGYRFAEDPYKDLDGDYSTYSVGLGYNFGNIYLDGAYDHTDGNTEFRTASGATNKYVDQDLNSDNFTVTIGYKF